MASITFHGDPVSTVGELPAVGSAAPAFDLVGTDLARLRIALPRTAPWSRAPGAP